jgi:hypothetical protein
VKIVVCMIKKMKKKVCHNADDTDDQLFKKHVDVLHMSISRDILMVFSLSYELRCSC